MMRNCLVLAALLSAAPLQAEERASPVEFLVDLTRDFNSGDLDDYSNRFAYPHSRVLGTNFLVVEEADTALRSHSAAVESGWAYSRINAIVAIEETASFALMRVNFSRFGQDGAVINTFDAFYTLALCETGWKVLHLAVGGPSAPSE